MEIEIECGLCGKKEIIVLSKEQYDEYCKILDQDHYSQLERYAMNHSLAIDLALEGLDADIINMLKYGLCSDCISK